MTLPTTLVLAGGASHRVWPLQEKLLLRFGSQSLLQRHLSMVAAVGCERLIVVANPQNVSLLEEALAKAGTRAEIVIQPEPRGMADAVLSARSALARSESEVVYITQPHDVVDRSLHESMVRALSEAEVFAWIAGQVVESYFPGGYLQLDGQRVVSVVEKPEPGSEPSNLVNIVAHAFRSWPDLLAAIEAEAGQAGSDDVYERALTSLMAEREVRALKFAGRWQPLKFPWDVLDVMDMLLARWSSGEESPGDGYEQRESGVFFGRDVTVYPGSHVVAPSLIGHGSVIGHNALVRGSVVGDRSVVGFGSEVARSYLGDGVELHHSYVGDSVLDKETSLGFGATTANLRVDGRSVQSTVAGKRLDTGRVKFGLATGAGVQIGVNTSTMPGSKIGAGAIIGPNLCVTRDVADGKRFLAEKADGRV